MTKLLSILIFIASLATHAHAQAVDYPTPLGAETAGTFPYRMIGQVLYDSGGIPQLSTGTVVSELGVLTAGHALYDPDTGWSTEVLFRRGTYGDTYINQKYARKIAVLGGYREAANFYGGDSV